MNNTEIEIQKILGTRTDIDIYIKVSAKIEIFYDRTYQYGHMNTATHEETFWVHEIIPWRKVLNIKDAIKHARKTASRWFRERINCKYTRECYFPATDIIIRGKARTEVIEITYWNK